MRPSALLLAVLTAAPGSVAGDAPVDLAVRPSAEVVARYDVFEISFRNDREYRNPFFDVSIDVEFRAPSGKRYAVGGFHYGSSEPPTIGVRKEGQGEHERTRVEYRFARQDLWKARFAPMETGQWTYRWVLEDANGLEEKGKGRFRCVAGEKPLPGFVRSHPENPFRFVFDDGSPFFPIGIQECLGDGAGTGSAISDMSMEGPFRTDRRPKMPPGPEFVRGPSNNPVNGDVYFRAMADCGFNLFRFSQANCSYPLYENLDKYLVQEGVMTDELLRHARKYGFRVFYGIFGYQKVHTEEPGNAEAMEKVKRFVKYSVDRWGAYVDFWEFLNEQKAEREWYRIMTPYLRSIDPYGHPIATSWERPELDGIEVNAPHWYQWLDGTSREKDREVLLSTDRTTVERAEEWKKHRKPVVVGEAGNSTSPEKRNAGEMRPEVGGVWDPDSATRMRIRNWTGFFSEIAYIFWVTSYARDGHFMNIWIGPKEREYVRAMQDFCHRLDRDVKPVPVTVSDPGSVRAYALASKERAAVYLCHFTDHENPVRGTTIRLAVPAAATGYWYSPTGALILGTFAALPGERTIAVPPFSVDLALLVTPGGPPDIDRDGIANDADPDDDNDGVPDGEDAFPLDPSEWADADGDLIGDNLDADDDADGRGDDFNGNGTPDHEEADLDGDGVPKSGAVPWDAWPFDPSRK